MTVLDANILLYAYNADAREHIRARSWLEALFAGSDWIGLPWLTLWAFLRLSTNTRVFPRPLPAEEAFRTVQVWLEHPRVRIVQPGPRHLSILERLVTENQAAGRLLSDAALAAMALEHGATLASTDHDFSRFASLHWLNPLGDITSS
jgi:toxin-antitoxin system PIN domain toxin